MLPIGTFAADKGTRLMPGDKVTITVFGQTSLSGIFQIDGSGNIEMPLIGAVQIGGQPIKAAEENIRSRLADGYLVKPFVSLRLSESRPVYVVGEVGAPGAFVLPPGSTVMGAIARAGGYRRPPAGAGDGALAAYLASEERVNTLEASRKQEMIRIARLLAQLDFRSTFVAPSWIATDGNAQQILSILEEERRALAVEHQGLENDLELLRQQRPRLEKAYEALEAQIVSEKKQSDLVSAQLKDTSKLQNQGLVRRSTKIAQQRELAAMESNMSRFRLELAQMTVALGDLDIRVNTAKTAYTARARTMLEASRRRVRDIDTILPTAREVFELNRRRASTLSGSTNSKPVYRITILRNVDLKPAKMAASEQTVLLPGDVLQVERQPTTSLQNRLDRVGRNGRGSLARPSAVALQR